MLGTFQPPLSSLLILLQMEKLILGDLERNAQGHAAWCWQSHRKPPPLLTSYLSCSTGQPHQPMAEGASTTEGPCTGMGDKGGKGLVPHPPTPLPAGPSTLRAKLEATAEPELRETFLPSLLPH